MGKIIFRFWLVNVLISVALFVLYRLVIAETDTAATGFLETIIVILDIIVNLGFSTIYLFAVILCSLLFFLNHIEKIRRNKGLSFLTFSGIPAVCLILLIIYILVGFYKYHMVLDPLKMLLLFSVIYLASTILEFILFRKIIKKQQADPKVQ
ncbi:MULTISPECIES: hypothetical protein [Sphingobacterium]|jgi:hypothetical protein|uniref:Uncharacterized protein n=2 Tax=Sphingobacterium TaxID=28453 RepID=A0ACD5C5E1_9SPHI|nr:MULTISPECIES: hypothetical protein [Sphingobacterium]HBI88340.1 hypothetical protein [Sphingobacterium sp.]MDF2851555.1 hypothetical protein [Sphingobacterium multivorum]OJZ07423.1 MAG: hypothetical protein BGP15_12750 [Sphingobacterium sp. 40-24]QQT45315.1 hypothetical protein I6J00_01100 [Sphingobacterium multivorum]QQT62047.1 hypothetical protein I6I97_23260 [Sphingobacterium multivorum]